ncbi:MAG: hypothetical protein RJB26_250 [Pseudomonadota bacterium]|jgi:cytochrome c5
MKRWVVVGFAAAAWSLVAAAQVAAPALPAKPAGVVPPAVNAADLPEGPGRSSVAEVCGACHPLGQALGKRQSRAEWAATVEQMVGRGAPLAPEEFDPVVDYLTAWYGTGG